MTGIDKVNQETFWEAERRQEQEAQDDHRLSPENELRRKRDQPEIPYYVRGTRTPAEIRADKEFRLKCLKEAEEKTEKLMIARYLMRKKKELEK